jgi:murein DD-endopeptidase MepM/ murein hydrolase activator NlpD
MGRVVRRAVRVATALAVLATLVSCAHGGRTKGSEHVVEPGENLYRIALRYGVTVGDIVKANHIEDPTKVPVGTKLFIPGESARVEPRESGEAEGKTCEPPDDLRRISQRKARNEADLAFEWPARGGLSTCFGERHSRPHEGIDIMMPEGTSVHAAEAGKVIYSDWMGAYGKVVIVKHAGHYASVYAHNRKVLVGKGDFIERGDVIAESGSTGNATGPHLHFEIRRAERAEDPLLYLP